MIPEKVLKDGDEIFLVLTVHLRNTEYSGVVYKREYQPQLRQSLAVLHVLTWKIPKYKGNHATQRTGMCDGSCNHDLRAGWAGQGHA
jgi:hypothetical protein